MCPFLHFGFPYTDTEQSDSPERPTVPLYVTFPLNTPITIVFSSARFVQHTKVKVKIKCTLVQAPRLCTGSTAHTGSRGIALLFLDHGARRGEGSASRPGRFLPPDNSRYSLYRRLGGPQCQSSRVICVMKACGHSMKVDDQLRAPAAFPLVSPVLI